MWKTHKRTVGSFFLLGLASFLLSSCLADKRTVDPYKNRSYTQSVAQKRLALPRSEPRPLKVVQPKKVAISSLEQRKEEEKSISAETMLPLLTLVDDRIVAYEDKSAEWSMFVEETLTSNLDEEQKRPVINCQAQVTDILTRYNDLHQQLISKSSTGATDNSILRDFLGTKRLDISFLESSCQQTILTDQQAKEWVAGSEDKLLSEREREIEEKMASGEYLEVIDLFAQLPLAEGEQASYGATYNFGHALLRTGREDDAVEVFKHLLTRLQEQEQIQREFKLMQLIADIQFGLENYDKSFNRYVDIINRYAGLGDNIEWARKQQAMISTRNSKGIEVRNYAELLRNYLGYNPERDAFSVYLKATRFVDDFPDSIVIPDVNHILYESKDRGEAWFALLLQRISGLRGEKKYQEALQLIDTLPLHAMPVEKRDQLTALADDLISISFEEEETKRLALEEAMQEIWSAGKVHLRAKEYDEAIEVFSTLLETSYGDQAKDKIVEASQLAAQEDRRKAAELFVRASKTADRDSKVALLLKSRQLLKGILANYPYSGLLDKTRNNLERIEQEISSIDPTLLGEAEVFDSSTGQIQRDQLMYEQPLETTINVRPLGEFSEQVTADFPRD